MKAKRKLDITKQQINCCDELILENDKINATYELWFDVDAYFGTNTKDFDEQWVNFYTDWDPIKNEITAELHVDKPEGVDVISWPLSDEEKIFFLHLMGEHCKKRYQCDLKTLWENNQ